MGGRGGTQFEASLETICVGGEDGTQFGKDVDEDEDDAEDEDVGSEGGAQLDNADDLETATLEAKAALNSFKTSWERAKNVGSEDGTRIENVESWTDKDGVVVWGRDALAAKRREDDLGENRRSWR